MPTIFINRANSIKAFLVFILFITCCIIWMSLNRIDPPRKVSVPEGSKTTSKTRLIAAESDAVPVVSDDRGFKPDKHTHDHDDKHGKKNDGSLQFRSLNRIDAPRKVSVPEGSKTTSKTRLIAPESDAVPVVSDDRGFKPDKHTHDHDDKHGKKNDGSLHFRSNAGEKIPAPRTLELKNGSFLIDGKATRLFSGALHYFRVVPEYWADRLMKIKAAGLNTVETYVAWNKHEEIKGKFNFEGMLNIRRFIQLAHSHGLYVILRPGPYICAEWEWGGMPSWLMRDPEMVVRSYNHGFLAAVENYFDNLFLQIKDLQFHNGGPILMVQIENEYATYGKSFKYMSALKELMEKHGIREQFVTSDPPMLADKVRLPGVLATVNFNVIRDGTRGFKTLMRSQPDKPLMVMEFWPGWFDYWGKEHNTLEVEEFKKILKFILDCGASFNMYMFHGGTNFGFMNGGFSGGADTTSYDYDAPVTENGDTTEKYQAMTEVIQPYLPANTELPPIPGNISRAAYGELNVDDMLVWPDILSLVEYITVQDPVTMEMLDINNGSGQSYGFIAYQNMVTGPIQQLQIEGSVRDRAVVLANNREVRTIDRSENNPVIQVEVDFQKQLVVDILVENIGRYNYHHDLNSQKKGLSGTVRSELAQIRHWNVYPLEFKPDFIEKAIRSQQWQLFDDVAQAPSLYRTYLHIHGPPRDTFLDMQDWTKGCVFVNGFNLGRYWAIGPTRTLYLPAPLLKSGKNQILIFELHKPGRKIKSIDHARLSTTS